jgi:hypothetical protein
MPALWWRRVSRPQDLGFALWRMVMTNKNGAHWVDAEFAEAYPKHIVEKPMPNLMECYGEQKQKFVLHALRTHNADALIVAANTGRMSYPKVYSDAQQGHHRYPMISDSPNGGWDHRFDRSKMYNERTTVVVIVIEGKQDDDGVHRPYRCWALSKESWTTNRRADSEDNPWWGQFMELPLPESGVLFDDGMALVYEARRKSACGTWKPEFEASGRVPDRIREVMVDQAKRVLNNFGQGKIL